MKQSVFSRWFCLLLVLSTQPVLAQRSPGGDAWNQPGFIGTIILLVIVMAGVLIIPTHHYLCKRNAAMHDIQTRKDIDYLVETFYRRVFADEQIGLIFTLVARVTPETHFPLMGDFWETILFGQNRYHGNVILKHVELHLKQALQPAQFDRWVSLFCLTVDDLFAGTVAETAKTRACAMSMVLQAKLRTHTQTSKQPA